MGNLSWSLIQYFTPVKYCVHHFQKNFLSDLRTTNEWRSPIIPYLLPESYILSIETRYNQYPKDRMWSFTEYVCKAWWFTYINITKTPTILIPFSIISWIIFNVSEVYCTLESCSNTWKKNQTWWMTPMCRQMLVSWMSKFQQKSMNTSPVLSLEYGEKLDMPRFRHLYVVSQTAFQVTYCLVAQLHFLTGGAQHHFKIPIFFWGNSWSPSRHFRTS